MYAATGLDPIARIELREQLKRGNHGTKRL